MRAFVTGGTGFVGRHLIDALLRRGDEVTALIRSPGKARMLEGTGVRLVSGDLDDPRALRQAAEGQEIVYHVAGLVAARNEAEFLQVNRDGTRQVLDASAAGGVPRFVLISSMAAGGPGKIGQPLQGNEPPGPVTAYGRSKLAGEALVREGPLAWTILRPPAVYGPGDREILKVFKIVRLGIAPVFRGDQQLSLVYGPDLGEAIAATGHSPATIGGIFYPCHPEIVTSAQMVQTIGRVMNKEVSVLPLPAILARSILAITAAGARLTGKRTVLTPDKAFEFYAPAWTADPAPLTTASGWRAAHDFATGTIRTLEWYQAEQWM